MRKRTIALRSEAAEVEAGSDGTFPPLCFHCETPLDLHQPEPATPEGLLGTCGECGAWYLVDPPSKGHGTLLARLPDGPALRAAWASPGVGH